MCQRCNGNVATEDISGIQILGRPVSEGGLVIDYRLAMLFQTSRLNIWSINKAERSSFCIGGIFLACHHIEGGWIFCSCRRFHFEIWACTSSFWLRGEIDIWWFYANCQFIDQKIWFDRLDSPELLGYCFWRSNCKKLSNIYKCQSIKYVAACGRASL